MLLFAAIALMMPTRLHQPDQGIAQANPALGHLSLTLIALVYVLLTVWQA